jgi:hypothetical protein
MTLRLGPLEDMNDPAEADYMGFSGRGGDPDVDFLHLLAEAREVFHAGHKLACFTQDVPGTEEAHNWPLAHGQAIAFRGYARDRMWAQYAENHSGICLFFDRSRLEEAFQRQLSGVGALHTGGVVYSDDLDFASRELDLAELSRMGRQAYLEAHRDKYVRELYFRKRTDWSTEYEYRLLLLARQPSDVYQYISIKGALTAVCLGHRFPKAYHPCIMALCERENIPAHQIVYLRGPIIVPFAPTAARV